MAVPVHASSLRVIVDGNEQSYRHTPVVINNTTLVPTRLIFESLGARVHWDEANRSARAEKEGVIIVLRAGSPYAGINGDIVRLDIEPLLLEGVLFVPVRFVGEALGAEVKWDSSRQMVLVSTTPQEAGEQENRSIPEGTQDGFSYEQALELALRNSSELKNTGNSVIQAEERRNQLANLRGIGYTPVGPGFTDADAAERELLLRFIQADIAWQLARRQLGLLEEGIAFQLRGLFDSVLQKSADLAVSELKLSSAIAALDRAQTRARLGLESRLGLENAQRNLQEEYRKRDIARNRLEEAYLKFNHLLGVAKETRFELEHNVAMESLGDLDLDNHINKILNDSPSVWMQQQKIRMAQLEADLYTYNVGAEPYMVKEIEVKKEENNLAMLKRDLENTVRAYYQQLIQLENQHSVLEANRQRAEQALYLAGINYKLGLATAAEVQEAEITLAEVNNQLQNIILSYNQLRFLFEKPWGQGDGSLDTFRGQGDGSLDTFPFKRYDISI